MKKLILIGMVGVVVVVLALLIVPLFFVNSIVKAGVETIGPKVTKVPVTLERADISIFSGRGALRGLFVGNPEGYKTPSAIQAAEIRIAVEPRSVLSDKVIVRSLSVEAPEITFEGGLSGNNLKRILDNVTATTAGAGGASTNQAATTESAPGKKLQVDQVTITGGKVNLSTGGLGGRAVTLALPTIQLTGLGTGPDGITSAELTRRVLNEVMSQVGPLVANSLSKLGQDAVESAVGSAGKEAGKQLDKVTKGVGDLFKKK